MKLPSLRTALLITLACGASGALLIALVLGTHTLTVQSKHPAELLPASTAAYFAHPQLSTLRQTLPWFPELLEPQIPEQPEAIALIPGSGSLLTAVFIRGEVATPHPHVEMEPFTIVLSDQSARAFFETPLDVSLQQETAFASLAGAHRNDESWSFMRRETLPEHPHLLDRLLLSLLPPNSEAVAFVQRASHTLRVTAYAPLAESLSAIDSQQTYTLPAPSFSLTSTATPQLWNRLQQALSQNERGILQAQLQTALQDIFGEQWSLKYDLLPLFSNAQFEWAAATGSTLYAVSTTGEPAAMSEFYQAIIAPTTTVATEIEERDLSEDFSIRSIHVSEADQAHVTSVNGWSVHRQTGEWQRTAALQEGTLIITNAPVPPERLGSGTLLSLPTAGSLLSKPIAGGTVQTAELLDWLQRLLPVEPTAPPVLLLPATEPKRWSLSRTDPLWIVEIAPLSLGNPPDTN